MEWFKITLFHSNGEVAYEEIYECELLSEAVDNFLTDHHGTAPGEKMLIEQLQEAPHEPQ